MGAGLAQLCAQAGLAVRLNDVSPERAAAGLARVQAALERDQARGRLSAEAAQAAQARLTPVADIAACAEADLALEAAPEDLDLKRALFQRLDEIMPADRLLASNTSALSITAIGAATRRPERVLGLHFFNPPQRMALVEVVRGLRTAEASVAAGAGLARALGKTPIVCRDTPGFIANRVARPFYGEAFRLLSESDLEPTDLDALMRSAGFKMGPCELLDLIGLDVNLAVTQAMYSASFHDPRYRPHPQQPARVAAGLLGRKTGRGFYTYPAEPAAE